MRYYRPRIIKPRRYYADERVMLAGILLAVIAFILFIVWLSS